MNHLLYWFNRITKKHRELRRWQRIVTVLAAIMTFATTYALILPAITVEKNRTEEVAGMYLERSADLRNQRQQSGSRGLGFDKHEAVHE